MEKIKKSRIEVVKEKYLVIQKKFSLPAFEELAKDFDIEKSIEKQTSFLLRDIRRVVNEKLTAYLNFFETLRNPSSAPMFVFLMLKNTSENDKKQIEEIYKKIAKIEIFSIKLDTVYSEEKEAEFLKNTFNEWQTLKSKIFALLEKLEKSFDSTSENGRRGYFG